VTKYLDDLLPLIGSAPTSGGTLAARSYHQRMIAVLKLTPTPLSPDLRRALMRRERRWRRRAQGLDARWNAAGSSPGRLPRYLEYQLSPPDPIFAAAPTDADFPARPSGNRVSVSRGIGADNDE